MDSSFQKGFFYVVLLFYIYIPFGEIALNEAWRKEKKSNVIIYVKRVR